MKKHRDYAYKKKKIIFFACEERIDVGSLITCAARCDNVIQLKSSPLNFVEDVFNKKYMRANEMYLVTGIQMCDKEPASSVFKYKIMTFYLQNTDMQTFTAEIRFKYDMYSSRFLRSDEIEKIA